MSGSQIVLTDIEIPIEKQQAMGDVFDRWRLNCGWNPWDNVTQDMAIASFVHTLDREKVPYQLYGELYERFLELRAKALNQGRSIPGFGVELLVSCWIGEHGLREEIRKREIDAGRTLTSSAESQCERCDGLNMENVFDEDGKQTGTKKGCDHRPIVEGEGLWKRIQQRKSKVRPKEVL